MRIRSQMRASMDALHAKIMAQRLGGEDAPMQVRSARRARCARLVLTRPAMPSCSLLSPPPPPVPHTFFRPRSFREVDPFDLWLWLELYRPPAPSELEMLQVGGGGGSCVWEGKGGRGGLCVAALG